MCLFIVCSVFIWIISHHHLLYHGLWLLHSRLHYFFFTSWLAWFQHQVVFLKRTLVVPKVFYSVCLSPLYLNDSLAGHKFVGSCFLSLELLTFLLCVWNCVKPVFSLQLPFPAFFWIRVTVFKEHTWVLYHFTHCTWENYYWEGPPQFWYFDVNQGIWRF